MSPLPALLLSALVAQAPAAQVTAQPTVPIPAPPQRDPNSPPDGAPGDQQLWRDLRGATNAAVLHLARVGQCAYRITYGKYYQGLDAIIADEEDAAGRADARALRARIEGDARAAEDSVPEAPGTRECQYTLRDLEVAMPLVKTDRRAAASARKARVAARKCVERLRPLAETWKRRADTLEASLAAADAFATGRGTSLLELASSAAKRPAAAAAGPGAGVAPATSPASQQETPSKTP